jgi:hypothetical protein
MDLAVGKVGRECCLLSRVYGKSVIMLDLHPSHVGVGFLCDRAHVHYSGHLRGIAPFSNIYILCTCFVVPIGYHKAG